MSKILVSTILDLYGKRVFSKSRKLVSYLSVYQTILYTMNNLFAFNDSGNTSNISKVFNDSQIIRKNVLTLRKTQRSRFIPFLAKPFMLSSTVHTRMYIYKATRKILTYSPFMKIKIKLKNNAIPCLLLLENSIKRFSIIRDFHFRNSSLFKT